MSYLGSTPTTQNFIAGTDQFTGTGAQTNWTLTRAVNSVNDIQITIANVVQNPTSYSVSGNTLTISPAVGSGTVFYVRYLSTTLQSITIPPGSAVNGNFGIAGNLQFSGTGNRITGDFSNATHVNRVAFQTSTVNGSTSPFFIPNGTGNIASVVVANAADPTNSSFGQLVVNGTADVRINSGILGTGTYLPMTFYTGGNERVRIDTSGNFQFNSGYGSVATAYGCRAWVNFNGTGTVAIRASGNVSSITDNGTGDYTVNFTNAMPDVNYSAQAWAATTGSTGNFIATQSSTATPTVSALRLVTRNNSAVANDLDYVQVAIFR